ncbi:MAG: cytochrome c oxidase subunit 3 [Hyphomicrobiaceae bacterium]
MNKEPAIHPGINLGTHHGRAHDKAEVVVFGFWVFLMSDLIIFGLFFATYITMLSSTAGGPGPSDVLNLQSAFIQTLVLLFSSFTMGMAALALKYQLGSGRLVLWLCVTFVLGAIFLWLELSDFADMFAQDAYPSRSGYLSAFFGLVPLHGLHVFAGLIWLLVMMLQVAMIGANDLVKVRLLRLSLFWHFLDIIWIGIFSIVYLGGLSK